MTSETSSGSHCARSRMLRRRAQEEDSTVLIDVSPPEAEKRGSYGSTAHASEPGGQQAAACRAGSPAKPRIADFVLVWEEDLKLDRQQDSAARDRTDMHRTWRETFLDNLRAAGLCVDQQDVQDGNTTVHYALLSASWAVLCYYAEDLRLKLPLQELPNQASNWSAGLLAWLGIPNVLLEVVPDVPPEYYSCRFRVNKLPRFLQTFCTVHMPTASSGVTTRTPSSQAPRGTKFCLRSWPRPRMATRRKTCLGSTSCWQRVSSVPPSPCMTAPSRRPQRARRLHASTSAKSFSSTGRAGASGTSTSPWTTCAGTSGRRWPSTSPGSGFTQAGSCQRQWWAHWCSWWAASWCSQTYPRRNCVAARTASRCAHFASTALSGCSPAPVPWPRYEKRPAGCSTTAAPCSSACSWHCGPCCCWSTGSGRAPRWPTAGTALTTRTLRRGLGPSLPPQPP
ncbi:anoctamin-7 isoform X25 [Homo sapiens]|uniref:anoctamin-7 isoform X25 n=1 Tax=Homo sapiens TaxID=9606 RepID=UPI001FB07240|nr:anoctamin-7 isoform X25 [Homo sapiens]